MFREKNQLQPVEHEKYLKSPIMANSIGRILQVGVVLSAMMIVLGLLLLPSRPGGLSPQRVLAFPQTLSQVIGGVLVLRPQAVIALGILLLIATPVLRVVASVVAFAVERDRRYVVITLIVLVILLFSIVLGGVSLTHEPETLAYHFSFSLPIIVLIFLGSLLAGLLGSLVGLGGGVLIVPLLTLAFGLPLPFAIGASIISVIATSSGAAVAYVKDGITNLRIGMFLELGTTIGALCGAYLAGLLAPAILSVIFGIVLLISAAPLVFKLGEELPQGVEMIIGRTGFVWMAPILIIVCIGRYGIR